MSTELDISKLTKGMLDMLQAECPVQHRFAPGVYIREMLIPAGTLIVGHVHKTKHFNIMLCGRIRVFIDGRVEELAGPQTILSSAGVQKVGYALEDTIWQTIHPSTETDIEKLEAQLVEPSQEKIEHEKLKGLIEV